MAFTPPSLDTIKDEKSSFKPPSLDSIEETPAASSLKSPDKIDIGYGVNQPSQFSSGEPLGSQLVNPENPDYAFTKAIAEDKGKQLPALALGMATLPLTAIGKPLAAAAEDVGAVIGGNPEGFGNLKALKKPVYDESKNPFQSTVAEVSKTNPYLAAAAKTSDSLVESAPMLAAGMPEGVMGNLVKAGFSAQILSSANDAIKVIGTEMGKNPEDRNMDALTSAYSSIAQSPLGLFLGTKALKPVGELIKNRISPPQIQGAPAIGSMLKTPEGAKPPTESETSNASKIQSTIPIPQPEIRPPVGESPPLRQQPEKPAGQGTQIPVEPYQEPSRQPPEQVMPTGGAPARLEQLKNIPEEQLTPELKQERDDLQAKSDSVRQTMAGEVAKVKAQAEANKVAPKLSVDEINSGIDKIVKMGEERKNQATPEMQGLLPTATDWLTSEEMGKLHELKLQLPSYGQLASEARQRLAAKRGLKAASTPTLPQETAIPSEVQPTIKESESNLRKMGGLYRAKDSATDYAELGNGIYATDKPVFAYQFGQDVERIEIAKGSKIIKENSGAHESLLKAAGNDPQKIREIALARGIDGIRGTDPDTGWVIFNDKIITKRQPVSEIAPNEHAVLNKGFGRQPTPTAPVEKGNKEPWQMTSAEYQDVAERNAVAPRNTLYGSKESHVETTLEQLLKDKKITKAYFDKNRWAYGSQKSDIRAARTAAKANHEYAVKKAVESGKPVPPEVLADYPDLKSSISKPIETPVQATAKVADKIAQVKSDEGMRPAKEIKSELVQRLEKAIEDAPNAADVPEQQLLDKYNELKKQFMSVPAGNKADTISDQIHELVKPFYPEGVSEKKTAFWASDSMASILENRVKKNKITIEIPQDGTFTIPNTKEGLGEILTRAKRLSTTSIEPVAVRKTGISKEDREWIAANKQTVPESTPKEGEPLPESASLGAALHNRAEFARGGGNPTAMKYRLIDQERQQRGLEPLTKSDSISDQAVMDRAMAEIDKDPEIGYKLVKELNTKPRTIEDWENHVLLLRKIDLRDQYEKSAREAAQAYEDSQEYPDRRADMIAANIRTAELSDQLTELEKASRVSGSARGRALRSLQIMANEDYSLASLETQRRAAKGGAPLTDAERAELVKTANDYKKANDELQNHLNQRDQRIAEMEVKAALDKIALEAKQSANISPYIFQVAEKIVAGLDRRADLARKRIKERGFRFNTGIDPTVLADVAEIGASHIAHIGLDFAKWSAKMISDFGEGVKPHLEGLFSASQKLIDDLKAAPQVKRVVKKETVDSQISHLGEVIKKKIGDGEKREISNQVQRIARLFVEKGIKDREALIDAVHGVLKEIDPEITRRDAMDAISGYGDFKPLSRDEISVRLRGMKGEMQQISKLEDMAAGVPPRKTGMERRTPTDEERKLIKAVNEAKVKFQVPITDPLTQLKSALDTRKIQLENQIKDMQEKLASKNFSKAPRRELVLDRKAQELQATKERIAKKFKTEQRKYELANRTKTEKVFDFISNARRFSVLSGMNVLLKLAAYSATKIPTMAVTDVIGSGFSKLPYLKQIATKAPSEGALNAKALVTSVAKGLTQGIMDAIKTARTGESDLKAAFSTRPESGREWYNFFQTVHEVIKSPLRRTAFELSLAKRMEHAAKNGIDVTDPMTQLSLAKDAYLDSDKALLLENNRLAGGIRSLFKQLEQKNKKTGQVPLYGKIGATVGRVELPILNVPLNYAKQTLMAAFGLVSGSAKAASAFRRGIDTLKPEEADAIMRHLKYGTIGGTMLLYGFYDGYNNGDDGTFGGYYQPGEKRKDTQAGVGGLKIGEQKIAGVLLHNPVLAVGQLGHTMGAIMAKKVKKGSSPPTAASVATIVGLADLVNESPVGRTTELLSQLADPRDAEWAIGEHAKGVLVPQLIQEAARWTDKDAQGNVIKRYPKTPTEHVEMGIPVLRKNVSTVKK